MSDFVDFARGHGLVLDHVVSDNAWHRVRTDDKPRRRNGAYVFDGDRGVVINFATMTSGAVWRNGTRAGFIDKAGIRAQRAISAAQERARHAEASAKASGMVKRAALDAHPYLVAKGFPQEKGFVLDGELLIPMREFGHYSQINSLQRIAADGTKLFLAGGKAKGSVFFIGPSLPRERWLVEGYATGLSVRAALRWLHTDAQIVVCFSAGNLAHIGKLVRSWSTTSFVMADNDKSGAGESAAEETGLMWCMPGDVDTDANDTHQREGIGALAEFIRAVRQKREIAA